MGLALLLSACTSQSTSTAGGSTSKSAGPTAPVSVVPSTGAATSSAAPLPVTVTATPAAGTKVDPAKEVDVSVANGTLNTVKLVNDAGKSVSGALSADKASWHSTEALGYSKTYHLVAKATDATGETVHTLKRQFTTLTPNNMTMPYLQRIGGYTLKNGATYGVAIVPVVHFDEPITNEKAAQAALTVTTSPHVAGAWYWADDQDVHWRPAAYYTPGTKVTIAANVYGKQVSPGLYGESDVKASFTIGRKQVTIADDNAPKVDKVRVYNAAGKVLRTMNTSMGKHSGETVAGKYINFYTLEGTYTVLEHDNPAIMSSDSYGLPSNAPGGYAPEKIYYSTKISIDGIYLHQLTTTVWAQNNGYDVSHGCLNLNTANAVWFYNHSMIGDPVEINHTGGPTIKLWQGGDWSVPWSKWSKGDATS